MDNRNRPGQARGGPLGIHWTSIAGSTAPAIFRSIGYSISLLSRNQQSLTFPQCLFARSTAGNLQLGRFSLECLRWSKIAFCASSSWKPCCGLVGSFSPASCQLPPSLPTTLYEFAPGLLPLPRAGDWTLPLSLENWQLQYSRLLLCRIALGMEWDEGIAGNFKPCNGTCNNANNGSLFSV